MFMEAEQRRGRDRGSSSNASIRVRQERHAVHHREHLKTIRKVLVFTMKKCYAFGETDVQPDLGIIPRTHV
jgi:hypothetical protein